MMAYCELCGMKECCGAGLGPELAALKAENAALAAETRELETANERLPELTRAVRRNMQAAYESAMSAKDDLVEGVASDWKYRVWYAIWERHPSALPAPTGEE